MGKKRVLTYDCNEDDTPPNNVIIDNHHHHHHRHSNHQKPKKIKPEAKLLHTLSSHLKKLGKSRSRNTHLFSTPPPPPPPPPPATAINSHEKRKHIHGNGHQCDRDHHRVRFKGIDNGNHEGARSDDGNDIGVFEFGKDLCWRTLLSENDEDLFGGDFVFAPDLNASRKTVVVFEEDGSGCGSYIPDPVVNWKNAGDEGNCLYDVLQLSSQEDMINEFLKVNLFVS